MSKDSVKQLNTHIYIYSFKKNSITNAGLIFKKKIYEQLNNTDS